VRFVEVISQGAFERYFEELAEILRPAAPPDIDAVRALAARHGLELDVDGIPGLVETHGLRFMN